MKVSDWGMWAGGSVVCLAWSMLWFSIAAGGATSCDQHTVIVDTLSADTTLIVFDGRGAGQVFFAPDTIINAISVWVTEPTGFAYNGQLYVTTVDSTGRPIAQDILLRGPVVSGVGGGFGTYMKMKFGLDPPLIRGARGLYFFVVSEASCLGQFTMWASTRNPYGLGGAWKTGVSHCDGIAPGSISGVPDPSMDLIFEIDSCATTRTARETWGSVKVKYR